jgi:hypothetical protein
MQNTRERTGNNSIRHLVSHARNLLDKKEAWHRGLDRADHEGSS